MKTASLAAPLAALVALGLGSAANAADDLQADARVAEERLLGSGDEEVRFLALQPFTREVTATGVITQSFAESLAEAGVPAAAMVDAHQALAAAIDLDRIVVAGDRFHVRYEQAFIAEGMATGVGRVLWVELATKAKGAVAIHRFRPAGGIERFWLANGEQAAPPSLRLPLDSVTVSSGYGLRVDPLDKPSGTAVAMGPLRPSPQPVAAAATNAPATTAPVVRPSMPPHEEQAQPARRPAMRNFPGGSFGFGHGTAGPSIGPSLDIGQFEREVAEARRRAAAAEAAARAAEKSAQTAAAGQVAIVQPPPAPRPRPRVLFMHDGVDLVAPVGTPIYAAADGVVIGAAPNGGYGNWIRIDHAGKLSTIYGHLSEFAPGISAGVRVSRGELIGLVGNTGRSTGAHLHFEILSNGKAVDPMTFPEFKRAQLSGADLERFKKQVKRRFIERDRETAAASMSSSL